VNSAEGFPATIIGRYALFEEIAAGGMATVHYGRLLGPVGFSRTVAIKRLHPHLAKDPEFAAMFLDEARVAARVRHPNVVPTLDIVSLQGELFLVMEYVQGESLARLLRAARRRGEKMPPSVAAAIMVGVLHGLHAAHESKNERGQPLGIVHRDVSPQNVLVGLDGIPRLVDFGVAKAAGRVQTTREGQLKGKIAYMAPEQIRGAMPTRLVDVYASAILFWEMLAGERLFGGDNDVTVLERALHMEVKAPSELAPGVPKELDTVVLRGLTRDPEKRFQSARDMAREIENVTPIASVSKVGEWVESIAGEVINERAAKVAEIESRSQVRPGGQIGSAPPPPLEPPQRDSNPSGTKAVVKPDSEPPVDQTLTNPVADVIPMVVGGDEAAPAAPPSAPSSGPTTHDPGENAAPWLQPRIEASRRKLWIAGGALGVMVLLAIVIGFAMSGSHPATASTALSASATDTPPESAAPPATLTAKPPATSATIAVTTATTTATAAATATATAPATATATATVAATATTKPTVTHTWVAHPTGKPNCNPPYTIDAKGVKQYKVECL
jgi:serine/threonine protein kinase